MRKVKKQPECNVYEISTYRSFCVGSPILHIYENYYDSSYYARMYSDWYRITSEEADEPENIYMKIAQEHGFFFRRKTDEEIVNDIWGNVRKVE